MVSTHSVKMGARFAQPSSSARARRLRRLQRGLTVYVVVLVIAMLSAVGVFAAKSASLALAQGGYVRQATQTHYIAEYSIDATLAALSTDMPGYIREMEKSDTEASDDVTDWRTCQHEKVKEAASLDPLNNARCYKFGREGLDKRFQANPATPGPLIEPPASGVPGSLGRFDLDARFMVEASDLSQIMVPRAGERSSGSPVRYYSLTLSAVGDVSPPHGADDSVEETFRTSAMSVEGARVQVTLGPVPAR